MKAKVVIQNGKTNIELTPENDFERDFIEKCARKNNDTKILTDYTWHHHKDHKITIEITDKLD